MRVLRRMHRFLPAAERNRQHSLAQIAYINAVTGGIKHTQLEDYYTGAARTADKQIYSRQVIRDVADAIKQGNLHQGHLDMLGGDDLRASGWGVPN